MKKNTIWRQLTLLGAALQQAGAKELPASRGLLVAACLALLLLGVGAPDAKASDDDDHRGLVVMTRNMDNGTDFGPIFAAQTQAQLVGAVTATYAEIQASNIPERAKGIAQEIRATRPDLVGLQEVFTYRVGPHGVPATTVTYDALQSLLDALATLGLDYAPIAVLTNLDAQVPALLFDVRATDHDVLLARTDRHVSQLKIVGTQAQHFTTNAVFSFPVLGTLTIPRGFISVDGKKRGKAFRFLTTQLESFSSDVQAAQASELLAGPAITERPLIFAGDFNADAQSTNPLQNAAYQVLIGGGLMDAWTAKHPGNPGFTWPLHSEDPYGPATPHERLDLVLFREDARPVAVELVGNLPTDLTPSGLWPSDHAGLVARFNLDP